MAGLVTGVHHIARNNVGELARIVEDIWTNKRLLAGSSYMGVGAFAYFIDKVPVKHRNDPLVVFEVEEEHIGVVRSKLRGHPDFAFFRIQPHDLLVDLYVPITVLGFRNVPGYPDYRGEITFLDPKG